MVHFLITTLVTALGLLVTDILFAGVNLSTFAAAMLAAIALGAVNSSIRPILGLLTLPINLLTLGGFSFIVNGFCFWLSSLLVPGFSVNGLLAFLLGPVILSLSTAFLSRYVSVGSGLGNRSNGKLTGDAIEANGS